MPRSRRKAPDPEAIAAGRPRDEHEPGRAYDDRGNVRPADGRWPVGEGVGPIHPDGSAVEYHADGTFDELSAGTFEPTTPPDYDELPADDEPDPAA